jgi:hypothetical protein
MPVFEVRPNVAFALNPAFAPRRRLTLSQLFWAVGSFDQTARFPRTKDDDE